ncbi:MAG: flippase activity-associated protein Agl23 [Pyrinomonadaceae bacterium]
MATGSTKRNRKKARSDWGSTTSSTAKRQTAEGPGRRKTAAPPPGEGLAFESPPRAWFYASVAVLLVAAALRLYALELKPLHHDEGVNGFFLSNLLLRNSYKYDPANYHGPTLYYLTLPFVAVTGLSTFVIRLIPSLFGVGAVWLLLSLRRWVGWVAALSAAALVAVSPAFVFYSRYFIHEMPFVFFTLGLVVAALRFRESGSPADLLLAAASAAMMFATKETAFISVGTLCLAWLTAVSWERIRGDAYAVGSRADGPARLRAGGGAWVMFASAAALFALIWVAFYTSFFFNAKGLADSLKTFAIWQKTGMSEFHGKPWHTYFTWLFKEDAAILVLGALGAAVALFERRRNRFAVFFAAWGFGLLAAYSLISYKTPWLVLNFLLPLAVAAGYAVQAFGEWAARALRGRTAARWQAAAALLVLAGALGLYQTFVVNFREYDEDRHPYVYSQTRREFLDLVREIERIGERAGTKEPGLATASPDYWPLPWYFRDNSHAGYEGRLSTYYDPKSTLAVIGKEEQLPQLEPVMADAYARVGGVYPLRPGVNLVLYARRDLMPKAGDSSQ